MDKTVAGFTGPLMTSLPKETAMLRFIFHTVMTILTGGVWLVGLLFYKYVVLPSK